MIVTAWYWPIMRSDTVRCSLPEAFIAPRTVPTTAQQMPTNAIMTMNQRMLTVWETEMPQQDLTSCVSWGRQVCWCSTSPLRDLKIEIILTPGNFCEWEVGHGQADNWWIAPTNTSQGMKSHLRHSFRFNACWLWRRRRDFISKDEKEINDRDDKNNSRSKQRGK